MDDFDVSGPAASGPPPAPPLSDISIAYAVLTYFVFAFLAIGLIIQTLRLLRQLMDAPPELGRGSLLGRLFRAATDVFLLRSTFFADRWAWIFGAAFHFGLVLILFRHLRYFLDPSWVGPVWKIVELEQPFGFYGGMALPLGAGAWWLRQIFIRDRRIISGWADHLVMALLVAIPLVGFANTIVHTDVVAVKAYAVGLVVFDWKNLPNDPLLLIHLWLVAALMAVLPFSRLLLLLPFGKLLEGSFRMERVAQRQGSRLAHALGPTLVVILLIPLGVVARHGIAQGFHRDKVDMTSLVADHRTDDATVMISNHPKFLFNHRTAMLHSGQSAPGDNLERCVTCHAVKDASGQPVGFDDPTHFCRGCHTKAAVTIDCFECHSSKPTPEGQAMLMPFTRLAFNRTGAPIHAEREDAR